jgi:hypothetical protein
MDHSLCWELLVRRFLARLAGAAYIGAMYLFLPVMPLLASLVFWRKKYLLNYVHSLKKTRIHIAAMRRGPAVHYFQDVLGQVSQVPDAIEGECIQCGNCCMNHQCLFLEQVDEQKYLCGIYHSPLRALSNCGSFPLNRDDIERYACPSYFVVPGTPQTATQVLHFYKTPALDQGH